MKYELYISNEKAGYDFNRWVWEKHAEWAEQSDFDMNPDNDYPHRWTVTTTDMPTLFSILHCDRAKEVLGEFSFTMKNF